MSKKRSTDFHEDDSIDNFSFNPSTNSASHSAPQASSGVVFLAMSVFSAVFNQWQQLVMFLSPYVEMVRSLPKKLFSDVLLPFVEWTRSELYDKFTNYTSCQFVTDVVTIMLNIVLFPLTLTVAILRTVRDKCLSSCAMCCGIGNNVCTSVQNFGNCSHECWLSSTSKQTMKWLTTTYDELRSGDITWKNLWNDVIDCIETQLQRGIKFFGETSKFTWLIKTSRIGRILEMVHLDVETIEEE